jgi:hemoglobin
MADPMLAHFFWNTNHEHLVAMQVDFVSNLLGGPKVYQGASLQKAHEGMTIRPPHFRRRQRLLQECMQEEGLPEELGQAWLGLEERLKPLIMRDPDTCRD